MKKIGILRFLGTNCDCDVKAALDFLKVKSDFILGSDGFSYQDYSGFILAGGFSYGDYLRSGALAALSKSISELKKANQKGMPILGICNGFQILCEAKLLKGRLLQNENFLFINRWESLNLKSKSSFLKKSLLGQMLFPIAHGEGRYYIDSEGLESLKQNDQIWLTYENNPNGSVESIAGILNSKKNVAALMPHPERAMDPLTGSFDGKELFKSWLEVLL